MKKRLKKKSIFFSIFFPIFSSPQEMSGNQCGFEFQCCFSCGHMEKWPKRLKKGLKFFFNLFSIFSPIFFSIFFSIFIHGPPHFRRRLKYLGKHTYTNNGFFEPFLYVKQYFIPKKILHLWVLPG